MAMQTACLLRQGSGATTFESLTAPEFRNPMLKNTITLPFNDPNALSRVIDRERKSIACVILEPVVGNIGCVLPRPGFLEALER